MKPAAFAYVAPRTITEAVAALAAGGSDAKLLAGGQSLVPLLNFRLARPTLLVDLNRVAGLSTLAIGGDDVTLGAMTRHHVLEHDADLAREVPLLGEASAWIGHAAIRNRGTLGGSLAHADPAAELPAVAVCLDASLRAVSPRGERHIGAEQFFGDYLTTALADDELLVDVRVPRQRPGSGSAWVEFARRQGDFALVGVAVSLDLAGPVLSRARIVLAGVGSRPMRVPAAEAALLGSRPGEQTAAAAALACASLDPSDDLHASRAYRLALADHLTAQAIDTAVARARRGQPR